MADDGRSPSGRAFVPSASSPQAVSPVPASIPSAVGFTGTQNGCTEVQHDRLKGWLGQLWVHGYEWMRNGDCVGADEQAGHIWNTLGLKIALHPPTVLAKRAFIPHAIAERPRPYLDRNKDIVRGAEVVVATPTEMVEQLRSGTWSTVRFARQLSKPILIIFPDGTYRLENRFAQAIEARRAETQSGSVHESAVGNADAPTPSPYIPTESPNHD
jgi:hypothetical protein